MITSERIQEIKLLSLSKDWHPPEHKEFDDLCNLAINGIYHNHTAQLLQSEINRLNEKIGRMRDVIEFYTDNSSKEYFNSKHGELARQFLTNLEKSDL